jgi:hypothetical protein
VFFARRYLGGLTAPLSRSTPYPHPSRAGAERASDAASDRSSGSGGCPCGRHPPDAHGPSGGTGAHSSFSTGPVVVITVATIFVTPTTTSIAASDAMIGFA